MSTFFGPGNGILGAPLDESHHPFKRSAVRPGGPAGRRDEQLHKWECEWMPPTKSAYRQKCFNIQNPNAKPKIVKVPKAKKKRYNKKYRAGHFPKAKRFKVDKRHPGAAYQPKKSRTWARASKKR